MVGKRLGRDCWGVDSFSTMIVMYPQLHILQIFFVQDPLEVILAPTPHVCSFSHFATHLELLSPEGRLPVERMCLLRGRFILLPHLDRLVRLAGD